MNITVFFDGSPGHEKQSRRLCGPCRPCSRSKSGMLPLIRSRRSIGWWIPAGFSSCATAVAGTQPWCCRSADRYRLQNPYPLAFLPEKIRRAGHHLHDPGFPSPPYVRFVFRAPARRGARGETSLSPTARRCYRCRSIPGTPRPDSFCWRGVAGAAISGTPPR